MKNVNGLYNAMRIVESACEEGEITIIGQGATPTAEELLTKCVAYINKQYNCDILNQVIVHQDKWINYEEGDDEWEDDEEEWEEDEEEKYIQINSNWGISIKEHLEEKAPYLSQFIIIEIIDELNYIVENLEHTLEKDYDGIYIREKIANTLGEILCHIISEEKIEELVNCILLILELNMSI